MRSRPPGSEINVWDDGRSFVARVDRKNSSNTYLIRYDGDEESVEVEDWRVDQAVRWLMESWSAHTETQRQRAQRLKHRRVTLPTESPQPERLTRWTEPPCGYWEVAVPGMPPSVEYMYEGHEARNMQRAFDAEDHVVQAACELAPIIQRDAAGNIAVLIKAQLLLSWERIRDKPRADRSNRNFRGHGLAWLMFVKALCVRRALNPHTCSPHMPGQRPHEQPYKVHADQMQMLSEATDPP